MKTDEVTPKLTASRRLDRCKSEVLKKWEEAVRAEVPAAGAQSTPALRDSLPDVLNQIVEALAADSPEESLKPIERDLAVRHGKERAETLKYTLDQMIYEYHVLRRILVIELEKEEPLTKRERDIIWDALSISVRNAATQFAEVKSKQKEKLLTRQISKTERLYELLIESIKGYAIFTLDINGYITTWNPGCVKMKQYAGEDVFGKHFEMLYPKEGRLRHEPQDHLRTALIEGRFRGEGFRMKKDGSLFLCNATIMPLYWEGKHIGFGKVVENVDERNQLIQERDVSKTEADSLKLEKDLIEQFVSALTHDLRTPLTAAKMASDLIQRGVNSDSENKKFARRISQSMERMDNMIRDLLDASRIKAGEDFYIDIAQCDLQKIASQVVEEMTTIYGDRFELKRAEPVVGIWSSESLIRILENLMANAVKYGDHESRVTIGLEIVESRVLLTVHNYGSLISLEDQLILFDRFRRTKAAKTSGRNGWGLGLTLVRGLAEANGGIVKVESYPKEGTRFTVDLPLDARTVNVGRDRKSQST